MPGEHRPALGLPAAVRARRPASGWAPATPPCRPCRRARTSLGGKVLRVDTNGNGVPGNAPAPFDPRIYTYGHRNVQGIAFSPGGKAYSIEHGTGRDDEVNRLVAGANYGWDPRPLSGPSFYDESRPMTDTARHPGARAGGLVVGRPDHRARPGAPSSAGRAGRAGTARSRWRCSRTTTSASSSFDAGGIGGQRSGCGSPTGDGCAWPCSTRPTTTSTSPPTPTPAASCASSRLSGLRTARSGPARCRAGLS